MVAVIVMVLVMVRSVLVVVMVVRTVLVVVKVGNSTGNGISNRHSSTSTGKH